MSTQPEFSPGLVFGAFHVDVPAGELRKHGLRVRLPPQPFEILVFLLAHPGEVVTREQLRERVWSEGTFVDFERGLNSAITKLRRALNDSADTPRFIETVPGRGYRFIGTVTRTPLASGGPSPISQDSPPGRTLKIWWWLAATTAFGAVSFALGWKLHTRHPEFPPRNLTPITTDSGLSSSPALSPDGKLVAYSSDHSLDGERDLYVKQLAGGQPVRLTSDGTGSATPDFSPDGSQVVFRSNRSVGGIFVMSAFGGEARLLARGGWNPKFSPDGSLVAYWLGAESVASSVPGSGSVWVVPASGGEPRRVGSSFTSARYPLWSPDGKRLLFVGYTSAKAFEESGIDWWSVSLDGGDPVKTGVHDVLVQDGILPTHSQLTPVPSVPMPGCWSAAGSKVLFSALRGSTQNLWKIGLSPISGKVNGPLENLTTGAGREVDPACHSSGAVAFTHIEIRQSVWSLPFNLDRGTPAGSLERIGDTPATQRNPSLSQNGRFLAFLSDHSGAGNVRIRDLATGKELGVASSPLVQGFPVSNASGSRIAFSVYEKDKRVLFVSAPGGTPERLCEGCLRATDWSRDEKNLLIFGGNPYQINLLELASHRQTPLLKHPAYHLLYGRYSPDNHWVSFTARMDPSRGRIAIAPNTGLAPVPESAWITIAEAAADDYANWSPDGRTLYFTSGRDGYNCLWGQRLDPTSHRPDGEVFAVQHLHGRVSFRHGGWSAAGGRIGLALVETAGNIWLMSTSGSTASTAAR